MIKKTIITVACFLSVNAFSATQFSCPSALPTNHSGFCASFKAAAECYCTSTGLPRAMCNNMSKIYSRMVALYGSVQRACEFQHNTSTQTCLDDWQCYRSGGTDSNSQLCSSTGRSCE